MCYVYDEYEHMWHPWAPQSEMQKCVKSRRWDRQGGWWFKPSWDRELCCYKPKTVLSQTWSCAVTNQKLCSYKPKMDEGR
jgi:hypothetical protein